MRSRDLRALEFDKVLALVTAQAVSEPGRRMVGALAPSTDPDEVRRRLGATSELVELRSHAGSLPIGEFKDQAPLFAVAAMEGATLDGKSLLDVRQFVLAARHLEAFLRSRCERFPAVAELVRSLLAPKEMADALLKALADDGGLLDDASRELKRLRTRLRDERAELESRLARTLDQTGMQPFLTDHLVTIRNRRFVLPMKPNYAERLEGIVQDRSVSGETLFVEPLWAVGLNNRLMMLEREVEAEERRILGQLTAMVRSYLPQLRMTFAALTALDALNARAVFAERCQCVAPEIVDAGLTLNAARHPLLLASGRTVVPIDVNIPPGSAWNRDLGPQHRRQDRRAQDHWIALPDGAERAADSRRARHPADGLSRRVRRYRRRAIRSKPTFRLSPRISPTWPKSCATSPRPRW